MPWKVERRTEDGKTRFCVVNSETGKTVHCHGTEAEAQAQMRALYANMPEARKKSLDDSLIFHLGGAVKALPDSSMIEGLLIPYGSPDDLDLDGEFFTAKTDFGMEFPGKVHLYYNHGLNEKVGRVPIAQAELWEEEDGVHFKADLSKDVESWLDGEREKAEKYRPHILTLAKESHLGASSGAASHVVTKRKATKGTWIARWPVADSSTTPTPASARTFGTVGIKALVDLPDPEEAVKCCGCGPYLAEGSYQENVPAEMTMAALSRLNDALFYRTVSNTIRDDKTPLEERLTSLRRAFDAYRDLALRTIEAILSGAGDEDAVAALTATKTLWGPTPIPGAGVGSTLAAHSSAVVSAAEGYAERLETRLEARVKSGRMLSAANHDELTRTRASLAGVLESLDALLEKARPQEDEEEGKAAKEPPLSPRSLYADYQRTLATLNGVAP